MGFPGPSAIFKNTSTAERWFGWVLAMLGALLLALAVSTGGEWRDAVPEREIFVEEKFERQGREFAAENDREGAVFRQVKSKYYARTGLWWASVLSGGLLLGLAVTRRIWVGDSQGRAMEALPLGGRFWLVVSVAVLLGAWLRWERMGLSLYNDEAYTFHRHVAGEFEKGDDGELEFEWVGWEDTLWDNHLANNSPPFSVLSRLSYSAWTRVTGTLPGVLGEPAFRFPAFVGGLAAIVIAALLGQFLAGGYGGGIFAAFAMAMHPWAVRYGSEGRSYGLVLALASGMLLLLWLGLRRDRWRYWIGYALAAAFLLATFAGALFLLGVANAIALVVLVVPERLRNWGMAKRLVAANVMAAALYFLLMMPCLLQMVKALDLLSYDGDMGSRWLWDQAVLFVIGGTWFPANPGIDPSLTETAWRPGAGWGAVAIWGVALAGLVIFGARRLLRGGAGGTALLGAGLATVPVAFGLSHLGGSYLFPWYTIVALPGFIVVAAAGLQGRSGARLAIVAAALMAIAAIPLHRLYRVQPKEPVKEAVQVVRAGTYPDFDPDEAVVAGLFTEALSYDPYLQPLRSVDDLEAAVGRAESEDVPLYVLMARLPIARAAAPEIMKALEGDGRFVQHRHLKGFGEPQFDNYIFELKRSGQKSP